MALIVLRLLAVSIGALAYYIAFFMYEDEEGKWQNRIERLWVDIDDREKLMGSKTTALFSKIANVITRGFNRILGQKLFSFQMLGVSSSSSFAALFLVIGLVFAILVRPSHLVSPLPEHVQHAVTITTYFCLIVGLTLLFLAALPSLLPSRLSVALSLLPLLLITAGSINLLRLHHPVGAQVAILVALLLSFLSDVLLFVLVRFTVRRVSQETSIFRVAIAILTQLSVITVLVVAPYEAAGGLLVKFGQTSSLQSLLLVAVFNVFTGLASSLFLLMLFVVLLHRVTWPLLGKLLYPLARHEVIRSHAAMASVGTACFIFAFPLMPSATKGILEWLAK